MCIREELCKAMLPKTTINKRWLQKNETTELRKKQQYLNGTKE